jgi:threonyl-tRNA synthetase
MAAAVLALLPEARLGIGPPLEHGFFYDFELPRSLTPGDLSALEARRRQIIEAHVPCERLEQSGEDLGALPLGAFLERAQDRIARKTADL